MAIIKVLIADDHLVVREGLSAMLNREPDIEVVGEAASGREAITKASELKPDIILMDLRMPDIDGVEAMFKIREENTETQFIVLTTYDSDEYIFRAIETGARAYLLKDAPRENLFQAIRAVFRGESVIAPTVASRVLDRFAEMSRMSRVPEVFTERELEVLALMAKGASNKDIATKLSITQSTVKSHVQSLFQKMQASSRTEVVTKAISKGLIKL